MRGKNTLKKIKEDRDEVENHKEYNAEADTEDELCLIAIAINSLAAATIIAANITASAGAIND